MRESPPSWHTAHAGSRATYVWVWIALLALSGLTAWLSFVPLGGGATPAALGIAAVKGLLILLYFMHIREQRIANAYVLVAALILVGFFVGLTAADIPSRSRHSIAADSAEGAAAAPGPDRPGAQRSSARSPIREASRAA